MRSFIPVILALSFSPAIQANEIAKARLLEREGDAIGARATLKAAAATDPEAQSGVCRIPSPASRPGCPPGVRESSELGRQREEIRDRPPVDFVESRRGRSRRRPEVLRGIQRRRRRRPDAFRPATPEIDRKRAANDLDSGAIAVVRTNGSAIAGSVARRSA